MLTTTNSLQHGNCDSLCYCTYIVIFSGGASYRPLGLGPTIFVRALPRALPLGQETKKYVLRVVHSLAVLKGHPEC